MVHLLVSPNLGPRAYFLGFQGSQPGLEPGLSTAEVCHHGLHLLAGFLVQHVHLPRVLSLLVLLQQPAVGGSIAGPAHALGTDLWRTGVFSLSARPGLETVDGGGGGMNLSSGHRGRRPGVSGISPACGAPSQHLPPTPAF